jgi:hypothetical protein
MPRHCTVCAHSERGSIEKALVAGNPLRDIARRCRVSKDALARHKERHLPKHLVLAKEAQTAADATSLLQHVEELRDRALRILAEAETSSDLRTALSAIREARGCVELLAKLAGELREGNTVNVLVMPEWAHIRSTIVTALRPYPEARAAVASVLKELPAART